MTIEVRSTLPSLKLLLLLQISKAEFTAYCRQSPMFASLDKNKDRIVSDIEVTSKAQLAFQVTR